MRKMMLMLAIAMLGLAADQVSAQKVDLLSESDLFTPDAKVDTTKDHLSPADRKAWGDLAAPFVPLKFVTGTKNGVAYRYFLSDGSGSFEGAEGNGLTPTAADLLARKANWSVDCKKDAIDDSIMCSMDIYDLMIFVHPKTSPSVAIGGKNYPGSSVAIRIDQSEAIRGGEIISGADAVKIIEELKTGKTVTTRYTKWPENVFVDKTFDLYGFNEAYAYLNWAISKISGSTVPMKAAERPQ